MDTGTDGDPGVSVTLHVGKVCTQEKESVQTLRPQMAENPVKALTLIRENVWKEIVAQVRTQVPEKNDL